MPPTPAVPSAAAAFGDRWVAPGVAGCLSLCQPGARAAGLRGLQLSCSSMVPKLRQVCQGRIAFQKYFDQI